MRQDPAALHKIGFGGVYKTLGGRGVAVQVRERGPFGFYYTWVAKVNGLHIGHGSLRHCRKLIRAFLTKPTA